MDSSSPMSPQQLTALQEQARLYALEQLVVEIHAIYLVSNKVDSVMVKNIEERAKDEAMKISFDFLPSEYRVQAAGCFEDALNNIRAKVRNKYDELKVKFPDK